MSNKPVYILIIKNIKTNAQFTKEFESQKLAEIYRDYHFAFGDWVGAKDIVVDAVFKYSKDGFESLRERRNKALKDTDWTQLSDVVITQEERKQYRAYRQYLRDVPSLHTDDTVVSAEVCSFPEWKLGKR